jgi:archaeosine-15-forming tRNA-guanine transglycosylase
MSLGVRFLFVKRDIRVLRSSENNGRSVFAKLLLAVIESLRPSFTVHEGPPTYII